MALRDIKTDRYTAISGTDDETIEKLETVVLFVTFPTQFLRLSFLSFPLLFSSITLFRPCPA